jgi:hypothetical protein
MKMSIERVRNNTDRVELKYCDKNLVQSHIFSTTYSSWNVLETNAILRVQRSAKKRLSHGTA